MTPNPDHKDPNLRAFRKHLLPSQKLLLGQEVWSRREFRRLQPPGPPGRCKLTGGGPCAVALGLGGVHWTRNKLTLWWGWTFHPLAETPISSRSVRPCDDAGRHTARRQRYGSAAASQKARPDLRCASLPSRFKTQKLLIRFTVNSAPLLAIVNYNVFILSFINKIVSVANKAEDYPNIRVHKTPQTLNQWLYLSRKVTIRGKLQKT